MQYKANSPEDYINQLPKDRQLVMGNLREIIKEKIPKGFQETISYGMIGYVVPHSRYPDGYHCSPELPLPFMNIASQKNFVAVYHMGVYAKKELLDWFTNEYPKHCKRKLDMGKSCIRFKYMDDVPYKLIGELASKMTVDEWIGMYESNLKKK
ncbi:DUF1801 domain-containing protein [Yeosuana sp.]|uniref:DUF1801 domain-containing protein n=1 Tax=Yeosuana sp. TaxID=2529388 RepID=UPI004054A3A7|tara:strand:+ start:6109 stop:6567 length:459 start_codon:yes stop_codon:yes gene_type:complete